MASLKERFERFILTLQGVENIDTLVERCNLPGRQRADYLAFGRRVIIEQKSLEADLHDKVQASIDDFLRTHGEIGTDQIDFSSFVHILAQSPDGSSLRRNFREMLTQRIDDILAKADKQTRDTRKLFFIPSAVGVVVILNENIQLVAPDFVVDKAFDMLRKRLPTGEIRYPDNQVVVVISEAHRVRSDNPAELIQIETIFSDAGNEHPLATPCTDMLKRRWAEFNNASYIESPILTRDVTTRDSEKVFWARRNP